MSNPSNATVGVKPAFAYAGQDMSPWVPRNSYINESATAIDAAIPVVRGSATTYTAGGVETCKPMSADTDDIVGVSVRMPSSDADSNQNVKYERYAMVPVRAEGRVAVLAAEDVRGGDEVIVVTAGAAAAATAFASSKGGVAGTGRVALKGWKWCGMGTITAGTLAEIEGHGITAGRTTT